MSGHNKWSQIKRKKEASDRERSKEFSYLVREIKQAVRTGGEDPGTNTTLRAAIERARAANMPKAGIERAIERGAGRGAGGALETVYYEAYGPGGAALLIQAQTDNKNRTVAELKQILTNKGGSLADAGSVRWMFKGGVVSVPITLEEKDLEMFKELYGALEAYEDTEKIQSNVQNI